MKLVDHCSVRRSFYPSTRSIVDALAALVLAAQNSCSVPWDSGAGHDQRQPFFYAINKSNNAVESGRTPTLDLILTNSTTSEARLERQCRVNQNQSPV